MTRSTIAGFIAVASVLATNTSYADTWSVLPFHAGVSVRPMPESRRLEETGTLAITKVSALLVAMSKASLIALTAPQPLSCVVRSIE